jgi:hypothetical protein
MLIATGIVFIVWLHRAYTNLRALGAKKLRFGPGWAIGGWFVPIWSAFRPKQIVNDVWRGSDPELAKSYGNIWDRPVPGWWMIWWLLWGIPFSVGIFFLPLAGDPTSPQELRVAAIGDVVGQALVVVTAVLAVLIVGAVTRRQDERATRAFRARASRRSRGRTRASLG